MRVAENTMPHDEKSIRVGKDLHPCSCNPLDSFHVAKGQVGNTSIKQTHELSCALTFNKLISFHQRLPNDYALMLAIVSHQPGELVLTSQRFREQNRNVNDCLAKLSALLIKVLDLPKTRRATQPTRASKTRRLERKKHRSATKKLRRKIID